MIYVLSDSRGHLKIGRSRALDRRLQNLQTGDADHHAILLLVVTRGAKAEACLEANFHAAFAQFRVGGGREWYADVPPVRAWCLALAHGNRTYFGF